MSTSSGRSGSSSRGGGARKGTRNTGARSGGGGGSGRSGSGLTKSRQAARGHRRLRPPGARRQGPDPARRDAHRPPRPAPCRLGVRARVLHVWGGRVGAGPASGRSRGGPRDDGGAAPGSAMTASCRPIPVVVPAMTASRPVPSPLRATALPRPVPGVVPGTTASRPVPVAVPATAVPRLPGRQAGHREVPATRPSSSPDGTRWWSRSAPRCPRWRSSRCPGPARRTDRGPSSWPPVAV